MPVGKYAFVASTMLVALAAHEPAEELLGAALVVDVGRVDEVDAGVARGAPDLPGGRLVGVAAERHRAERDARDLDPGLAEEPHRHALAVERGFDAREDLLLGRRHLADAEEAAGGGRDHLREPDDLVLEQAVLLVVELRRRAP